jgi:hypothetical protein
MVDFLSKFEYLWQWVLECVCIIYLTISLTISLFKLTSAVVHFLRDRSAATKLATVAVGSASTETSDPWQGWPGPEFVVA